METRNRRLPKADQDGLLRRVVGITPDGRKARFTVGNRHTSPAESERRVDLIRRLYKGQCERRKASRWSLWTIEVAKRLGQGKPISTGFLVSILPGGEKDAAQSIRELASYGVPVSPDESQAIQEQRWKQEIDAVVAEAVRNALDGQRQVRGPIVDVYAVPQNLASLAEQGTFHEALRAYAQTVKEKPRNEYGKLTPHAQSLLRRLKALQAEHEDFPLRQLDVDRVRQIVAHWQSRPVTRKGTPASDDWVQDVLKTFRSFAKWLDLTPAFNWTLPRGFDDVTGRVRLAPQEKPRGPFRAMRKKVYSIEELTKVLEFADPWWRTAVALTINTTAGQAEIGRLRWDQFSFNTVHPYADELGFVSTTEDSWTTGERPKTKVYGEHLLWKRVADAVVKVRRPNERDLFLVNDEGVPWYRDWTDSPSSNFDREWRETIVERAQEKYPKLPRLPWGSLRDMSANLLREKYGDEVSSLSLKHGETSEDTLLSSYTNEPYARLFHAIRELEPRFQPILDLLP